jgi:citrate lyase subunit beta/citryl-CoA lyase
MRNQSYLMRSLMFVPGHNHKLLLSAAKSQADVLLLDIEDSVQPESNKTAARNLIKSLVIEQVFANRIIFPRINDRESGHLLRDLYELSIPGVEGFMYPKAKTGEDVYFIDKLIETIEYEKKIPIGTFKIIVLVETTAAVLNAQELCQASKRVVALAYGCEDFIADLRGVHDERGHSLFVPRALIAMAARANGVIPIDTVHIDVHNIEDLEYNLQVSKNLGFEGMLVLNPKELPFVHQHFSPSPDEYQNACEIIHLSKSSISEGKGVAIRDGRFVGPPLVTKAENIIDRYNKIFGDSN